MRTRRAHLIPAIAVAIALTSQSAAALPSWDDPTTARGTASEPSDAEPVAVTLVPPANDELANAAVAAGLPFAASLSTLEATTAPDDPSCVGNVASVWFAYTPPVSTTIAADTFGSDYDTTLAAYTGTPGSLVEVACNDDAGSGPQSQIVFPVVGGQTYYLMAAGLVDAGSLSFHLDGAAFPLLGVRTTSAYEATPSAAAGTVAWSQATRRSPRWTLYVQRAGEQRVRVNRARTHGFSGGFEGETFVYQEVRGSRSELVLYDLSGGGRSAPPAGVNTRQWEWHPTISGDWLLFGRQSSATRADLVLLRNLVTGQTRRLGRLAWGRRTLAEPGQVAGNYAVWFRCTPLCDVFLHDIAAGTTTRIPNPNRRQQYDPAVTSDGTVYFMRSGRGCGTSVRLVRHPLGGTSRVLASLGAGRDSSHTYALENDDGTTTVLFDRVRCTTRARDIFKVVDP
ncbi:MAG TPA: hypothetical protein VD769_06375 [Gaiellaceae bacterium]|nr:hypothetical protein [Gaiellaceae bacterium]